MTMPVLELGDETPTSLYRLYGASDALLYIGITDDLKVRFSTHARLKSWWPDVARKTVELHAAREDAEMAELEAIGLECPLHNIAGRGSGPFGIDPGDLPEDVRTEDVTGLVMLGMPPQSLRLALLELAGIPTGAALAMLGVGPTHRYRVINQRKSLPPRSLRQVA